MTTLGETEAGSRSENAPVQHAQMINNDHTAGR